MITIKELKAGLIKVLKDELNSTDYKIYSGLEVIEGYKKPSFFTHLELLDMNLENKSTKHYSFMFLIDYFQPEVDEIDMLDKADLITSIYSNGFKVKDRFILPTDISTALIGSDKNILEVEIDFDFYQETNIKDAFDLMEEFELSIDESDE